MAAVPVKNAYNGNEVDSTYSAEWDELGVVKPVTLGGE